MILAPKTMLTPQSVRIKTDMRDAYMITQCLSYGGYHAVYIPRVEASVVDRVAKTEKFLLSPEGAQTDIRIAERRCFCGNFNKSVK